MKAVTAVVVLCLIAYAVAVDVDSDAEGPDWLNKSVERQKRRTGRASKFTMHPRVLPKQHFVPKKHIFTVPNGEASLHADNDGTTWMSPAVELPVAAQNTPSVAPSPLPVSSVPVLKATPGAMCTNAAANIRATPSTSGKVLFTTTNGESVRVTASKETSANGYVWVPVSARSQNGYIAKTLLRACSSSTPSSTPASTSSYPLYKQCGQSWSSAQLGSCSGTTVCKAGCAISSISMLLAKRGVSTNPGVLNTWLKANGGYSGCAVYWAKVDAFGKTKCQGFSNPSYATLCANVKAGYGLILNVNNGGHWVLATGCDGKNNVYVNDPGFSKSSYPFSGIVRVVTYK